jgi:single-strand selective monofunctional uracil DNA glycosylase
MNPGPFGMAQNGVPFGDTSMVKEWLKVEGIVGKPLNEHPKRKVYGLECPRGEVSGTRFWSLWRTICGTPDQFFENCYVHNYCPLCYMTSTGKNVTPSAMTVHFRRSIEKLCDSSLVDIIQLLNVNVVVGVGKYAEECMRRAVSGTGLQETLKICSMPHPSPANPNTRNNWEGQAIEELKKHEILSLIENKQVTWE